MPALYYIYSSKRNTMKNTPLVIRLSENEMQKLDRLVEKENAGRYFHKRTRSSVVRDLILASYENYKTIQTEKR